MLSQADNDFIQQLIGGDAWLGGNDRNAEGTWRWPDDTQFWSGGPAGAPATCTIGQEGPTGNCYAVYTNNLSWWGARDDCQGLGTGWALADIASAAENSFIATLTSGDTWIGASDRATEDRWVWLDGTHFWQGEEWGSPVGGLYNGWNPGGEPNDYYGQDCAITNSSGTWYDRECNDGYDRVCEGPMQAGGSVGGMYANWDADEPDDSEGTGSPDCLRIRLSDGQWEDFGCDSTFGAVCEGPMTPISQAVGGMYNSWQSGEPNDGGGISDCAVLSSSGTWRDTDCGGTHQALCRGPMPPPPPPPTPPVGGMLTNVTDAAACTPDSDAQWYFDNNADPTSLSVCPATCDRIRLDRQAQVSIEIGCYPPEEPPPERVPWVARQTYTELYEADCGEDQPQWGFLAPPSS